MKDQLTTEQIARVFAMYVHSADVQIEKRIIGRLTGVAYSKVFYLESSFFNEEYFEDAALILTHFSRISAEDAIEVALTFGNWQHSDFEGMAEEDKNKRLVREGRRMVARPSTCSPFVFQHLINRGYALPLWIAPNHPCNGLTAIEMGLAIDSSKS